MKAHVSEANKKIVKELTDLIKKYSIVGIVDMENLPAKQLQNMKEKLRQTVVLRMSKKRLMRLALENVKEEKKGLERLEEYFQGMPALICTEQSPFDLFKTLKKNKSNAPAKPGQIAPSDIEVKSGPTPFAPGPVIGELGSLGIKTKIENNKIVITENSVVAKEGEEINAKLAGILTRLDIKPIEIGLNLIAVYDHGDILTKEILDIDEEAYLKDMKSAHVNAITLATELAYPVEGVIESLISKIYNNAKTLALEQEILNDETKEFLMQKAENSANNLNSKVPKGAVKEESVKNSKESESTKVDKEPVQNEEVKEDKK